MQRECFVSVGKGEVPDIVYTLISITLCGGDCDITSACNPVEDGF